MGTQRRRWKVHKAHIGVDALCVRPNVDRVERYSNTMVTMVTHERRHVTQQRFADSFLNLFRKQISILFCVVCRSLVSSSSFSIADSRFNKMREMHTVTNVLKCWKSFCIHFVPARWMGLFSFRIIRVIVPNNIDSVVGGMKTYVRMSSTNGIVRRLIGRTNAMSCELGGFSVRCSFHVL